MLRRLLLNGQMVCSAKRCRRLPELIARVLYVAIASGSYIAIFKVYDSFVRDSTCTLAHPFLTESYVKGEEVECPTQAGRFKVRTGEGL